MRIPKLNLRKKREGKSGSPLKYDPVLINFLARLETIDDYDSFKAWRGDFVHRLGFFLVDDGIEKSEEAYHATFRVKVDKLVRIVSKIAHYVNDGSLSLAQVTAQARNSLNDGMASCEDISTYLKLLAPSSQLEESLVGFTKYNIVAVLVEDSFREYERLNMCRDILQVLREYVVNSVAEPQHLAAFNKCEQEIVSFKSAIVESVGLSTVLKRQRQLKPPEPPKALIAEIRRGVLKEALKSKSLEAKQAAKAKANKNAQVVMESSPTVRTPKFDRSKSFRMPSMRDTNHDPEVSPTVEDKQAAKVKANKNALGIMEWSPLVRRPKFDMSKSYKMPRIQDTNHDPEVLSHAASTSTGEAIDSEAGPSRKPSIQKRHSMTESHMVGKAIDSKAGPSRKPSIQKRHSMTDGKAIDSKSRVRKTLSIEKRHPRIESPLAGEAIDSKSGVRKKPSIKNHNSGRTSSTEGTVDSKESTSNKRHSSRSPTRESIDIKSGIRRIPLANKSPLRNDPVDEVIKPRRNRKNSGDLETRKSHSPSKRRQTKNSPRRELKQSTGDLETNMGHSPSRRQSTTKSPKRSLKQSGDIETNILHSPSRRRSMTNIPSTGDRNRSTPRIKRRSSLTRDTPLNKISKDQYPRSKSSRELTTEENELGSPKSISTKQSIANSNNVGHGKIGTMIISPKTHDPSETKPSIGFAKRETRNSLVKPKDDPMHGEQIRKKKKSDRLKSSRHKKHVSTLDNYKKIIHGKAYSSDPNKSFLKLKMQWPSPKLVSEDYNKFAHDPSKPTENNLADPAFEKVPIRSTENPSSKAIKGNGDRSIILSSLLDNCNSLDLEDDELDILNQSTHSCPSGNYERQRPLIGHLGSKSAHKSFDHRNSEVEEEEIESIDSNDESLSERPSFYENFIKPLTMIDHDATGDEEVDSFHLDEESWGGGKDIFEDSVCSSRHVSERHLSPYEALENHNSEEDIIELQGLNGAAKQKYNATELRNTGESETDISSSAGTDIDDVGPKGTKGTIDPIEKGKARTLRRGEEVKPWDCIGKEANLLEDEDTKEYDIYDQMTEIATAEEEAARMVAEVTKLQIELGSIPQVSEHVHREGEEEEESTTPNEDTWKFEEEEEDEELQMIEKMLKLEAGEDELRKHEVAPTKRFGEAHLKALGEAYLKDCEGKRIKAGDSSREGAITVGASLDSIHSNPTHRIFEDDDHPEQLISNKPTEKLALKSSTSWLSPDDDESTSCLTKSPKDKKSRTAVTANKTRKNKTGRMSPQYGDESPFVKATRRANKKVNSPVTSVRVYDPSARLSRWGNPLGS